MDRSLPLWWYCNCKVVVVVGGGGGGMDQRKWHYSNLMYDVVRFLQVVASVPYYRIAIPYYYYYYYYYLFIYYYYYI